MLGCDPGPVLQVSGLHADLHLQPSCSAAFSLMWCYVGDVSRDPALRVVVQRKSQRARGAAVLSSPPQIALDPVIMRGFKLSLFL